MDCRNTRRIFEAEKLSFQLRVAERIGKTLVWGVALFLAANVFLFSVVWLQAIARIN
jgi:hypothetical protein